MAAWQRGRVAVVAANNKMFLILVSSLRVFRVGHKGHKGVLRVVIRLGYMG